MFIFPMISEWNNLTGLFKIDNDNEDANCCENDSELQSVLAYADFMNRLAYVDNVPEKTVEKITSKYLSQSQSNDKDKEETLMAALNDVFPDATNDQIEKILECLRKDPFLEAQQQLSTNYKRKQFIESNFPHVKPIQVVLNKEEIKGGHAKDSYHYVSVLDSVRNLCEDETFQQVLDKERQEDVPVQA